MPHQVLYRKYRPSTFDQVVGQEHVVRTLTNALTLDKVAHAYLFTGPRGTGKTTTARLLARYVNCIAPAHTDKTTVCSLEQACMNCSALLLGNHPDVIEIDAASNRGIDEIRALKEGIRFLPVQAPYKFFIVDEVHMLTKEAFNALLKTLEEPPAHAIFVLATTEIHKVPSTIASRCQRFDFRRLTLEEIKNRLRAICAKENVSVEDQALELIAVYADGSQRDAESLLDQVIAFGNDHITTQETVAMLGLIEFPILHSFVEAFASKNASAALALLNDVSEKGYDMEQMVKALISYLREVLLLSVNPEIAGSVAQRIGKEQTEAALAQSQKFSCEQLTRSIERVLEASQQMKYSPSPQLPLEVAIVELLSS